MREINMHITQVTATGEEHGLINSYPNAVPFDDFKNLDPSKKEDMKKLKKEDAKIVKARYINHEEGAKGRLKKPYCRYAGDPILQYNLIHDYEYEVPLGFVREVNESRLPVRSGLQSVDGEDVNSGAPVAKDSVKRHHELVPVSF